MLGPDTSPPERPSFGGPKGPLVSVELVGRHVDRERACQNLAVAWDRVRQSDGSVPPGAIVVAAEVGRSLDVAVMPAAQLLLARSWFPASLVNEVMRPPPVGLRRVVVAMDGADIRVRARGRRRLAAEQAYLFVALVPAWGAR
jgi:hypothetical protein